MGSTETNDEFEYDLVTIGAGSGGVRASRFAAQNYGAKVAIIELPFGFVASDSVGGAGGTCVIRGCVPKKLLVYGSAFADEFRDATGFGWEPTQPNHNWSALIQRKDKEIQRLNKVYDGLLKNAGVDYIEGRGKLVDPHTVEIALSSGGTKRVSAKHILVATGGTAEKAPIEGFEHAITSDDALALEQLPGKRIVMVGAGYISLEFAGIFLGVGADVHVMYRKELPLAGFDEECRAQVAENLQLRGMHLYPSTMPTRIEKKADGSFVVEYTRGGEKSSLEADLVMFGTGRKPNTKGLGLQELGIEVREHTGAIKVDEYSRTNIPSVWAIGDVTDRIQLTPVALMEGMAFTATAFGNKPTKPDFEKVASAVFVQPPMATCGLTEEQAKAKLSGNIDVYVSKFRPMKNTLSGREERTLMKLIVNTTTDEVVGAHMVGPDAPEIMQGLAIAMKCNARKAQFDATVGIHPSAAEEFVTMRTRTRRVKGQGQV